MVPKLFPSGCGASPPEMDRSLPARSRPLPQSTTSPCTLEDRRLATGRPCPEAHAERSLQLSAVRPVVPRTGQRGPLSSVHHFSRRHLTMGVQDRPLQLTTSFKVVRYVA